MDYLEALKLLEESKKIISSNGIEIKYKQIPETVEKAQIDPRLKNNQMSNSSLSYPKDNNRISQEELIILREQIGGKNQEVTGKKVSILNDKVLGRDGADIPIRIYNYESSILRKCLIYIHGGGFIGGHLEMCENLCIGIAGVANICVISVDYRLCPEYKFPYALYDCEDVVKWVYEHPRQLNIDKTSIIIMGDSAGGNLSTVCALRDMQKSTNRIYQQILLYPALNIGRLEMKDYLWSEEKYDFDKEKKIQLEMIRDVGIFDDLMVATYLEQKDDVYSTYVTPLLAENLSNMPKTVIVTAEYDYLRLENEYYAKKLIEADVPVQLLCYRGMNHAFVELLGEYPQAEDCMNEIINIIKGDKL